MVYDHDYGHGHGHGHGHGQEQGEGIYARVEEPVRIVVEFHPQRPRIRRLWLHWREKRHEIAEVHLYHQDRRGEAPQHFLSVTADGKYFKLRFDGKKLQWFVEEVFEP